MGTMANDEINQRINAGRQAIGIAREAEESPEEMETQRIPTAVVAAGIGVALVGVGLLGWMFYRRRRRRTLIEQIRATLPDRVRDAREWGDQMRASMPDRMRDARDLRNDLMARLRKVV